LRERETDVTHGLWPGRKAGPYTTRLGSEDADRPAGGRTDLLKVHLHLDPVHMAAFFGLTGLAWYFQPMAGHKSNMSDTNGFNVLSYFTVQADPE